MGEAHLTRASGVPVTGKGTLFMVFVLDSKKEPLDPCHEARARELLRKGKAAVFRYYPFTIILRERVGGTVSSHRLKLDPGSKATGLAVLQERGSRVVWAAELTHRGQDIRDALLARRASRHSRRQRKTRYRRVRFLNRRRSAGWLAPSLHHRVLTTLTWAKRIKRLVPLTAISMELSRFDTQFIEDAEIASAGYQQGTLAGYEVREYLLEKWGRRCAYCGATDVPLQVEHLIPRARGGSNRVSNLTLACELCNQKKGNRTAVEFGFPYLMAQAKAPLRDAAAVNSVRWVLYHELKALGLPLEVGTGGRTKWNRLLLGMQKSHWLDAACHPEGTRSQHAGRSGSTAEQRAGDCCQGPRSPPDVPDRQAWFSKSACAKAEALVRLQDRRSGQSGCAKWEVCRHARGPGGYSDEWLVQYHHSVRIDSGDSPPALPNRPTGRWVCLRHENAE